MNIKRRYIYLKICMLVMFVWLTACNRDPHEGERGMAVTIDNTQCPNVPIETIKLYIYGTGGNLYATYNYADARGIAAVLHHGHRGASQSRDTRPASRRHISRGA